MKASISRDDFSGHYDVLIIGAGINGAGVFRDLCQQGLKCLLVDKNDFGSGTSAAPSRLIHGGIKYLETGEFRLVAESTLERNLLLKNAPHVVKPLQTFIPVRSWLSGFWAATKTFLGFKSSFKSRGMVLIALGLLLYDMFGRHERSMPRHGFIRRSKAAAMLPSLSKKIVGIGTYYDAKITEPERLVLELIEDGLAVSPQSVAANYCKTCRMKDGQIILHDFAQSEQRSATAGYVVNAAGPWIDRVNHDFDCDTAMIGGTKGSHIVLEHPALIDELDGRMIYFEGDDGRILLVFEYHGKALVGSTDLPADDPDNLECTAREILYFMDGLSGLFPGLTFDENQIVYSYAGLRPLPNSEGVDPGLISRDHSSPVLERTSRRPFPIMCLVGGKWTTFRAFAELVTDQILSHGNRIRSVSTKHLPIGGGRDFPSGIKGFERAAQDLGTRFSLDWDLTALWLQRYGKTKSERIALHASQHGGKMLECGYHSAELAWIALHEKVVHLDDVLLRRTQIAITGEAARALAELNEIVGNALNWSSDRRKSEFERTCDLLADHHAKAR